MNLYVWKITQGAQQSLAWRGARQEVGKLVGFVIPVQPGCQVREVCGVYEAKAIVWYLC